MKRYCLFEGRHELPTNEGALCSGFNFNTLKSDKTPLWKEALQELEGGNNIGIYVTGLTPALTEFLHHADHCMWEAGLYDNNAPLRKCCIMLYHYNSQTGEYVEQTF